MWQTDTFCKKQISLIIASFTNAPYTELHKTHKGKTARTWCLCYFMEQFNEIVSAYEFIMGELNMINGAPRVHEPASTWKLILSCTGMLWKIIFLDAGSRRKEKSRIVKVNCSFVGMRALFQRRITTMRVGCYRWCLGLCSFSLFVLWSAPGCNISYKW